MRHNFNKKIIIIMAVTAMLLAPAACGGSKKSEEPANTSAPVNTTLPGTNTDTPRPTEAEPREYTWYPLGEGSGPSIKIIPNGSPSVLDSRITVECISSDDKIFEEIQLITKSETSVFNKDNKPEWDNGKGGIFPAAGQCFDVVITEENWKTLDIAFVYHTSKGSARTVTISWKVNGDISVDSGELK